MDLLKVFFEATPVTQVLFVLCLVVLGWREWQRTRRERAERHDSSQAERFKAKAEADERRDALMQGLLEQNVRLSSYVSGLTAELHAIAQQMAENNKTEIARMELRAQLDQSRDKSLDSNTEALGDLINQAAQVRKRTDTLIDQVAQFPKQMASEHGTQLAHIDGKIDTAVVQAGSMFDNKIDPVQAALNELRETLRDVQEKVSHIPELGSCLNQTNQALQDLTQITQTLKAERDRAVSALADAQEVIAVLKQAPSFDAIQIGRDMSASPATTGAVVDPPAGNPPSSSAEPSMPPGGAG
jgi:predicted negative regulator of RcsB-dependent stress response